MLTREQILSVSGLPTEVVPVPEWGGSVIVTVMSGFDRDEFEKEIRDLVKSNFMDNARARLVVRCVVNDSGERLFTVADVEALGSKSWIALDRIATVAQRLNRLTDEAMEEERGNS